MHFSTALIVSLLSISISAVSAAPTPGDSSLNSFSERDLDAFYPEIDLERRSDFMDVAELEQRDIGDEEIELVLRDLIDSNPELLERDENGEFSELERRINWKKAAKTGLKIASWVLKRDEMPELEFVERDFATEDFDEILERDVPMDAEFDLERRNKFTQKLGKAARGAYKVADFLLG